MSVYEALRSTLETNPESLRSDQLIDELFWDTLDLLAKPNKEELTGHASAMRTLAREYFRRADPGPATWRLWYAGQVQGLASLLSAQLSRHLTLETSAAVRSRENSRSILEELSVRDMKVSDLAKQLDKDESYILRELTVLARYNLVETVKHGRERWARITYIGSKALAEMPEVSRIRESESRATMNLSKFPMLLKAHGSDVAQYVQKNRGLKLLGDEKKAAA